MCRYRSVASQLHCRHIFLHILCECPQNNRFFKSGKTKELIPGTQLVPKGLLPLQPALAATCAAGHLEWPSGTCYVGDWQRQHVCTPLAPFHIGCKTEFQFSDKQEFTTWWAYSDMLLNSSRILLELCFEAKEHYKVIRKYQSSKSCASSFEHPFLIMYQLDTDYYLCPATVYWIVQ